MRTENQGTGPFHGNRAAERHMTVAVGFSLEGCNLEVFTRADYVELETLSGEVTIAPEGHAGQLQRWQLLAPRFPPYDLPAVGAQAGCDSTAPEACYAP